MSRPPEYALDDARRARTLLRRLSHSLEGRVLTPGDVPRLALTAARMAGEGVDEREMSAAVWTICRETWGEVETLDAEQLRLVVDGMVAVCAELTRAPPADAPGRCCAIG